MRYTITAESGGDRILKIGQHLPKLWARIKVGVFFWTQCSYDFLSSRFIGDVISLAVMFHIDRLQSRRKCHTSQLPHVSGSPVITATDTPCLAPIYGLDCETIADEYKEFCVAFNWLSSVKIFELSCLRHRILLSSLKSDLPRYLSLA